MKRNKNTKGRSLAAALPILLTLLMLAYVLAGCQRSAEAPPAATPAPAAPAPEAPASAAPAPTATATEAVEMDVVVIEAEALPVKEKAAGDAQPQDMSGFEGTWQEGKQLWWTGAKQGDTLTLGILAPKTGKFQVSVQLTQAPDYAVVQFYVDGKEVGEPADLYADKVGLHKKLSLGEIDLDEGEHTLGIKILGANEAAEKSYMFGMDYVELKLTGEKTPPVEEPAP